MKICCHLLLVQLQLLPQPLELAEKGIKNFSPHRQLLLWVGFVDIAAAAVPLCTVVLLVGHNLGSSCQAWDFISKVCSHKTKNDFFFSFYDQPIFAYVVLKLNKYDNVLVTLTDHLCVA